MGITTKLDVVSDKENIDKTDELQLTVPNQNVYSTAWQESNRSVLLFFVLIGYGDWEALGCP